MAAAGIAMASEKCRTAMHGCFGIRASSLDGRLHFQAGKMPALQDRLEAAFGRQVAA
jgi:hypothetical protein